MKEEEEERNIMRRNHNEKEEKAERRVERVPGVIMSHLPSEDLNLLRLMMPSHILLGLGWEISRVDSGSRGSSSAKAAVVVCLCCIGRPISAVPCSLEGRFESWRRRDGCITRHRPSNGS